MKKLNLFEDIHTFVILWITQSFSTLGSSMTSFALIIWSYQQSGSAIVTSLLSVCSYAPYVVLSIFAGALSDRWNKKYTMLVCDSFAAISTAIVLILIKTESIEIWHLYVLNLLNGIMNTVQQPASDVAVSLLTPKSQYQRVAGMRSFSNSLVTVLTPVIATSVLAFTSIEIVILFDLTTFFIAFITLLFFVRIPQTKYESSDKNETVLKSAQAGLKYLYKNRGILDLILFLALINLVASMYNAALPAMLLSRKGGSETVLGLVNTFTGIANLTGSIIVSFVPQPKSRVRIICNALLFSMSTENFLLAFGRNSWLWCLGAILGWIFIPVMNANMDVLFRMYIPIDIQGRVYSARNTLQFFTIPVGYLIGGVLVDRVFEPFMEIQSSKSIFVFLVGDGKGSGAALLFFILGILGIVVCLIFRKDKNIWDLENVKK